MEKKIPTYLLVIDDSIDSELQVDAIAMVDAPAIERNFLAFAEHFVEGVPHYTADGELWTGETHKDADGKLMTGSVHTPESEYLYHYEDLETIGINFESYTDYPKGATENAKIALRWAEENGWGECGTPVGKIRANQLANGEAISRDTIARMAAFERHRQNSQKELGNGCGRLMWLAWGGDAGIEWAQRKLEQINNEKLRQAFAINDEKMELFGAAMLADMPIYRNDQQLGEYYVVFDKATIYTIAQKFFEKGFYQNFNLMHDPAQKTSGVFVFQSYIVDSEEGRMPPKGFEDAKDGSWFIGVKVNNPEVWAKVKSGEIKGFSVEGVFEYKKKGLTAEQIYNEIGKLLAGLNDTTE